MNKVQLKVKQAYALDEVFLEDLAQKETKSQFFSSSLKFYRSVKEKNMQDISKKQKKWLDQVRDILEDKARKQVQKNVQKNERVRATKCFTWLPKKTEQGWVWFTYYKIN